MTWFTLALACALSLSSADAASKYFFRKAPALDLLAARIVAAAVLLMPLVLSQPLPRVPPVFWGWLAVLMPLELLAMFLYLRAIRDYPLHLTLPFLAFTPVFNVITGYAVLRESIASSGMAGILLVVVGAYLLNLKRQQNWRSWFAPLSAFVAEPGARLMLTVAAIYSITSVGGKAAMGYMTPRIFGPLYFVIIGSALFTGMLIVRPSSLAVLYRRPGASLLLGLLMAVMVVTHFLGVARVEVAYFISVKRTSLLFGMAYGAVLFGERDFIRHFLSGTLMVAGVALIVASGS
jgi:drug/metabolite transporter (DMT)-like permease